MKIVFLNAWHGKMQQNMRDFMQEQIRDTDVFCFQEADDNMAQLYKDILGDYEQFTTHKFLSSISDFTQVTCIKKGLEVVTSHTLFGSENHIGIGLYTALTVANKTVHICNFHGLSRPVDKLDDHGRLDASQELIKFFQDKPGPVLIGGDFNLFPETKSIQMFEQHGYQDLIKGFGITNTRNRLAWERYPDRKQYYSDYAFVSQEVNVTNFAVPANEVSDHLPLIVTIEV